MSGRKGLFVGLTTVDVQYFVDTHPDENVKLKADEPPLVLPGGPAANAAIAFAALSGNVEFLTCVGENAFQSFIFNEFEKKNVTLVDAMQAKAYNPIMATVITNTLNSNRTIVTHHPDAVNVDLDHLIASINMDDYSFVFTDGFYPELAVPLCKMARARGLPVIFDGGSWKPQMPVILPLVDVAICSANFVPPGCNSYEQIFEATLAFGVTHIAISRGRDSIITPDNAIQIEKVKALDSLGAGDVLHGAFCYYFINGLAFENALHKASVVATFSTRFRGAQAWIEHWGNTY
jgi:sugar/nucleoside kinase (ribokinase family)